MANDCDLPCDGDGICMICKRKPTEGETLSCKTCATPWHVTCISTRPETLDDVPQWECPDCHVITVPRPASEIAAAPKPAVPAGSESAGDLIAAVRAIESDGSLTEQEKAKKRQELMSGVAKPTDADDAKQKKGGGKSGNDMLNLFDESLNCSFCMQLPDRPVTTPCGHNFCLKCFQKWVGQGKRTCANCRHDIPAKMASQPRINATLVIAIRFAKLSKSANVEGAQKVYHFVHNQNRPDKAFTTERAKKTGKANACSGKIFVTVPPDHFGPILAENDPERNQGLLVGESWEDRMECRQWGAHLPHVAGIAGQSDYGAQSVALSGGYEDDEDHGEWFLYTGSGGRDLSGNKRTNKTQSFDQKFDKMNEALRVSCRKGYPVRVVRSHKEKRSSYAPETGVRYDGVYRIEKCWRKVGIQGFKVCRYLFVRCDNDPAPWLTDDHGDLPRPLPVIKELKDATDISERKDSPSWDYDVEKAAWMWKKSPPVSRKKAHANDVNQSVRVGRPVQSVHSISVRSKLLKGFNCSICQKVMSSPITTPCAHNFCKACLEGAFSGQSFIRERTCEGRRTLRAQKNIMKCPSCTNDISDFLQNPQVNRELMGVIETLQRQIKQFEDNGADKETEENTEMKESEDNVVMGKETDGADANSDAVPIETETCEVESESVEASEKDEDVECAVDASAKVTAQPGNKVEETTDDGKSLEKASGENGEVKASPVKPKLSANGEVEEPMDDDGKSLEKPNGEIGEVKASPVKPKLPANGEAVGDENKPRRTSKRKLAASTLETEVKTRNQKAKKPSEDDDFE